MPSNWIAVIAAALLPMLIGFLWYGPLFGKKWMELMELTEEEIRADFNAAKSYGVSMIGAFLTAVVMAMLIGFADVSSVVGGLGIGLACWAGFYLPFGWQSVAFENKKMALYVMSMCYNLTVLLAMGALLAVWQ